MTSVQLLFQQREQQVENVRVRSLKQDLSHPFLMSLLEVHMMNQRADGQSGKPSLPNHCISLILQLLLGK